MLSSQASAEVPTDLDVKSVQGAFEEIGKVSRCEAREMSRERQLFHQEICLPPNGGLHKWTVRSRFFTGQASVHPKGAWKKHFQRAADNDSVVFIFNGVGSNPLAFSCIGGPWICFLFCRPPNAVGS
jgi:hypothetical protein